LAEIELINDMAVPSDVRSVPSQHHGDVFLANAFLYEKHGDLCESA
jgi:hypothetical protein